MASQSLTQIDLDFFNDVGALLREKYPELQKKFGIWKAHQHFDLDEDEVFHETSNDSTRESTLRIIKKSELPSGAFASVWHITPQGPVVASWCCDHSPGDKREP